MHNLLYILSSCFIIPFCINVFSVPPYKLIKYLAPVIRQWKRVLGGHMCFYCLPGLPPHQPCPTSPTKETSPRQERLDQCSAQPRLIAVPTGSG